ncbi:NAD-dependent epimerase/dehydratase family protein [Gemmata sp. JC717]|uniref:NAD-dependent epimerase/dehydratase family protein n=1 Tax=Gemmata algarum TaxID=2975278 RepID=A0ABU5F742_9BACT|nr:NAD-dependent epimerase/dehydratase family protein [Gemmata algarum]MDY3555902.1 NAD-dependent epimerase/dehydratase family protein [Gemmata algarum]MDY3563304.1 NAD-dependent epimerase/dehydratase family protein [Gemmata algarum]
MRYFVTGGAGFIGSNLVDRLLAAGHHVTAFDNFSTGQRPFLADALKSERFALVEGDLLDKPVLTRAVAGHDFVFHLAANADVRFGTNHPDRDLQQNTVATFNVLEAMRLNGVKRIGFSSTGSVYGEANVFPTPEDAPFPIQTSLYAASKVAGEGLISAYATGFGFQAFIFRFVSILGERYTHGHVFDFYAKLLADPHQIEVLGNGKQRKSYLYVQDCVDAIFTVVEKATEPVNVVNLGADEYCQVDDSLGWICDRLGLRPKVNHTGGARGWIGDSPFIFLDTAKLKALGWRQKLSIREAVVRTLDYLRANPWVLESRAAA